MKLVEELEVAISCMVFLIRMLTAPGGFLLSVTHLGICAGV